MKNRTESSASSAFRQKVQEQDKAATIFDVRTVQEEVDWSLAARATSRDGFAALGELALVLAAIGLYELASYGVAQRASRISTFVSPWERERGINGVVFTSVGYDREWAYRRAFFTRPAADESAAVLVPLSASELTQHGSPAHGRKVSFGGDVPMALFRRTSL